MAKRYYNYNPSLPAAIIFTIIFALSGLLHMFQLGKSKTWYFIPFVVGCLVEAIGYIGRAIGSQESPDWTLPPYVIQFLLLLLGPTFFAASIYMILGRLINHVGSDKHSLIRTSWMTKFFLFGDLVSIAAQGFGGGKMAKADTKEDRDLGQKIIVAGLAVQIVFFGLFMATSAIFHLRIIQNPTDRSRNKEVPWKRLLYTLYTSSILILVRSIFRIIEYIMGRDSELQSKEVYLYIFDSLLMAPVAVMFNVIHPSRFISAPYKARIGSANSEIQLGPYPSSDLGHPTRVS